MSRDEPSLFDYLRQLTGEAAPEVVPPSEPLNDAPIEAWDGEKAEQPALFEAAPGWAEHWKKMPAYSQPDQSPWQTISVFFRNVEDRRAFSELVDQKLTNNTTGIWYPKPQRESIAEKRYGGDTAIQPRYPIYIISKGRADTRLTSKALEAMRVDYRIVIEPQEYEQYSAHIAAEKILQLPFSNLGQGSIPARNWVWDHAVASGAERHWILDDNIAGFCRLHENRRIKVSDGAIFAAAENFVDRYENVALAGFQYRFFAPAHLGWAPFALNTRIYSCILIRNDTPYRWRGRYNEDTDLSLRVLKDGWCTILFNAFLCNKAATMTMKGGNTDELYKDDGRLKMAQELQAQHPDIVTITTKWGRPQHHFDCRIFRRNKLKPKPGLELSDGIDDYGMSLKTIEAGADEEAENEAWQSDGEHLTQNGDDG